MKLWRSLREIRAFVKKLNPGIVHNTMPYSHIVMSLALMGLSLKNVWFQHGPVGGFLDKLASCFKSHLLIFNSSYLQNEHHNTTWFNRSKEELVLRLGISFGSNREHPGFSDGVIKLGTSGRICEWKGFHHIIQALGEMAQSLSLKPFTYSIAGSPKNEKDKVYFESLIALVKRYSLQDKVIFLGHQEELISFYNKLDVFIHASTIPEPFGLVVAEAMAQECLIIGSDTGGVADILKNNSTAITYNSVSLEAVKELKSILEPILDQNKNLSVEKYRSLASEGNIFIRKEYSVNSMIKNLEERYLRL